MAIRRRPYHSKICVRTWPQMGASVEAIRGQQEPTCSQKPFFQPGFNLHTYSHTKNQKGNRIPQ